MKLDVLLLDSAALESLDESELDTLLRALEDIQREQAQHTKAKAAPASDQVRRGRSGDEVWLHSSRTLLGSRGANDAPVLVARTAPAGRTRRPNAATDAGLGRLLDQQMTRAASALDQRRIKR